MNNSLSLMTYLSRWERGHAQASPPPALSGRWRLSKTLPAFISTPAHYIRGQGQYFTCLTASGIAWFYSESSFIISEPDEKVVKLVLSDDILLISVRPGATSLRFSRLSLAHLQRGVIQRTEIFTQVSLPLGNLRQVDNSMMITEGAGYVHLWDLNREARVCSVAGQYGINTWYSNNYFVQVLLVNSQKVLRIQDLLHTEIARIKLPPGFQTVQAQVVKGRLFVVSCNYPVHVVDLEMKTVTSLGIGVPRLVLERESCTDALAAYQGDQVYLFSKPELKIELTVKNPVFADSRQALVVLEEKTCSVLSGEGRVLDTFEVPEDVTAVGINEDTLEVYVALKNGVILVYD